MRTEVAEMQRNSITPQDADREPSKRLPIEPDALDPTPLYPGGPREVDLLAGALEDDLEAWVESFPNCPA